MGAPVEGGRSPVLVTPYHQPEAQEQYRKALAIQERLVADFPAVPEYRQSLARSHHNLGVLLKEMGKRPEAEERYRKVLAVREELVVDFPKIGFIWEFRCARRLGSSFRAGGRRWVRLGRVVPGLVGFDFLREVDPDRSESFAEPVLIILPDLVVRSSVFDSNP